MERQVLLNDFQRPFELSDRVSTNETSVVPNSVQEAEKYNKTYMENWKKKNKDKWRDYQVKYRNSEKCKVRKHNWYLKNKERISMDGKERYKKNIVEISKKGREYYQKNRDTILLKYKNQLKISGDEIRRKNREYWAKNRQQKRKNDKRWREKNKDKICQNNKHYNLNNKDKIKVGHKNWRLKNKEYLNQKSREWSLKNPEKKKIIYLKYLHSPKGKVSSAKNWAKRYELEKNSLGKFTPEEWQKLIDLIGNICPSCKKFVEKEEFTVDHIVPLSKGGSNFIQNIQPLCLKCNIHKKTKTINYIEDLKVKND